MRMVWLRHRRPSLPRTDRLSGVISGVWAHQRSQTIRFQMITNLQYQLKAGSYYLYDMRDTPSTVTGERRFKLKTDLLAIAFDSHTGEVHQHGTPTRIQSWASHTRRRLRAAGLWQAAEDIIVISGPFPVEEFNKCLWVKGYCRRLLQRLSSLPHGKLQSRPSAHNYGNPHSAHGASWQQRRQAA